MAYTAVPVEDQLKIKELNEKYQKAKQEEERLKKELGLLIYKIDRR